MNQPAAPASIRQAAPGDISGIIELDEIAWEAENRRAFICRIVGAGQCWLAVEPGGRIAGYAALETSFFECGFVSILYVRCECRRHRVGAALLLHLESICSTPKLFTSTNRSNLPMQALLTCRGFIPSGVIENLDEDDPELIFMKHVRPASLDRNKPG